MLFLQCSSRSARESPVRLHAKRGLVGLRTRSADDNSAPPPRLPDEIDSGVGALPFKIVEWHVRDSVALDGSGVERVKISLHCLIDRRSFDCNAVAPGTAVVKSRLIDRVAHA